MDSTSPSSDAPGIEGVQAKTIIISWGAYGVVYFIQAAIMSMILMNVPVFLRQGLALDWLGVTASYIVMFVPVLLRPLFAWVADRRPTSFATFLFLGVILVIAGGVGASIGAGEGFDGIIVTTAGFAIAVIGATLMNVAADSHIIRAGPFDRSAKINSYRRIFAFLGIATGQVGYLLLVGSHYTDFSRWAWYFAVPAIIAIAGYILVCVASKGWRILPAVAGLPPRHAPWLWEATKKGESEHDAPLILGTVLVIAFLFMVPDGMIETTFENFIVDTYGNPAWITYSTIIMFGGVIGVLGYVLAGRSGKRPPEWDLLWYLPFVVLYYAFLWMIPPFQGVLWVTIALQVPATFIQVRLLQSWQAHSYSRRPSLLFQVFMATYQLGKVVGIAISGFVMNVAGYAGIFCGALIAWLVAMGFAIIYHFILKE